MTIVASGNPKQTPAKRDVSGVLPATGGQKALWTYCQSQSYHHALTRTGVDNALSATSSIKTHIDSKGPLPPQVRPSEDLSIDPGLLQVRFELRGMLDQIVFAAAWQATCEQFEGLRTTLHPHDRHEILLVCRKAVVTSVQFENWRSLGESEQQRSLEGFLINDRAKGIDLSVAPSSRVSCFLLAGDRSLVVWTCHHLLLDGWSAIVIVNALLANYGNHLLGKSSAPAELFRYSQFRRWIGMTDHSLSLAFWKRQLQGLHIQTSVCPSSIGVHSFHRDRMNAVLADTSTTERFEKSCKLLGLTTASVIQSAWILVVSGACRSDDVAVGISVAGRPGSLAGIETTAGFLANVVPLRGQLDCGDSLGTWLQDMQSTQFETREHDHISLPDILALAESGCQGGCFDNLLVIENLPSLSENSGPLQLTQYESGVTSGYPLTVTVLPGKSLSVTMDYSGQQLDVRSVENLADAFRLTLHSLLRDTRQPLADYVQALHAQFAIEPVSNTHKPFISDAEIGFSLRGKSAPRNRTELAMLGIFEEVLKQHSLSMDDDFFELGGRSVQVLKLVALIDQRFNRRLPIVEIFTNRTPLALAIKVQGAEPLVKGVPSLIALQETGTAPGLFCIHAGGGHALFYTEFARQLGEERPVYALQPRGIDGYETPLTSIAAMADHYVDAIIQQQPEGPYHLLGHCFSGALVPEMASQLNKRGKSVGHLIITDAAPPMPASHIMSRFGWSAYRGYEVLRTTPLSHWLLRGKALIHNRRVRFDVAFKSSTVEDNQAPTHLVEVQRACIHAFKSHRAQPCTHKLTILSSMDEQGNTVRDLDMNNWRKFAPNHSAVSLPVDHQLIFFEPGVRVVSNVVKELLGKTSENELSRVKQQSSSLENA